MSPQVWYVMPMGALSGIDVTLMLIYMAGILFVGLRGLRVSSVWWIPHRPPI